MPLMINATCIDDISKFSKTKFNYLTKGKTYKVTKEHDDALFIIRDDGEEGFYPRRCFGEVFVDA